MDIINERLIVAQASTAEHSTKIPDLAMLESILLSPPFEVVDMNTNVGAR
jgi:hypothetical protein